MTSEQVWNDPRLNVSHCDVAKRYSQMKHFLVWSDFHGCYNADT